MTLQHFRARISQSQINPGSSEETPLGTTRFSLSASSKGPGVLLYHVPFPLGLKDSNGEADTLRPRAAFYPCPQRPPGRRGSTAQSCGGTEAPTAPRSSRASTAQHRTAGAEQKQGFATQIYFGETKTKRKEREKKGKKKKTKL